MDGVEPSWISPGGKCSPLSGRSLQDIVERPDSVNDDQSLCSRRTVSSRNGLGGNDRVWDIFPENQVLMSEMV